MYMYRLCLKKRTNFEIWKLEIVRISFDDILAEIFQKTLEWSLHVPVFM